MLSFQRISDIDIDLWAIKGAIAFIQCEGMTTTSDCIFENTFGSKGEAKRREEET